jgi:protein TonB
MHAGGYLDRSVSNVSPGRVAIIVALHGAAIAALMLAKPEVIPHVDWKTLTIDPIAADPPPPPEILPPPPKEEVRKQTADPLPPIVPTGNWQDEPPYIPSTGDTGGATTVTPPPFTPPLTVNARFLKGIEIQPDYPTSLARQEIEGYATVRVLIGTDGRVRDVQQVSTTDPEFFRATQRQALRYWRFKPATRDGVPVESWQQMTVRFKLQG